MNHSDVAHNWAHDNYNRNGEINGSSMYATEHNRSIYSYGSHFCIARKTDSVEFPVLFTTRDYSKSTSKHLNHVRNALHYRRVFYCHDPGMPNDSIYSHEMSLLPDEIAEHRRLDAKVNEYNERIDKRADKGLPDSDWLEERLSDAINARDEKAAYIKGRVDELERFRMAFSISLKDTTKQAKRIRNKMLHCDDWVKVTEAEKIAAARAEARRKRELAEQQKRQQEENAERLAKWVAGDPTVRINTNAGGRVRLRVMRNHRDEVEVQTSMGARVSGDAALRLWKLVKICLRKSEAYRPDPEAPFKLNGYTLNSVTENGNVVIGCHSIYYNEMERISEDLIVMMKGETANV